jgi:hypothetical protein
MVTVYPFLCDVRVKSGSPPLRRERRKESPEYRCYLNAQQRCNNSNHPQYKDYGGRGIQFKFESFQSFINELGLRPSGMQIDRVNVDGNYEAGNVRWATRKVQNNNRQKNKRPVKPVCHPDRPHRAFRLCDKCYEAMYEVKLVKSGYYRSAKRRKSEKDRMDAIYADPAKHAAHLKKRRALYKERKQHEYNDTSSSNPISAAA